MNILENNHFIKILEEIISKNIKILFLLLFLFFAFFSAKNNLEVEGTSLHPNPIISNTFTIRWENAQTLQGVLFNSSGVQVTTIKAEKDAKGLFQCTLPNTLPTGQYFLRVQNEKGEERSFHMIK